MQSARSIVDLSVPLASGMPACPGDPEVRIEPALRLAAGDSVNVLSVHMGSQSGTHLDAPYHVIEGGARLDELPLERFVGPAVVADLRSVPARSAITLAHLAPVRHSLRPGAILLLHTGWARHWGGPTYLDHPWLSADAAAAIVEAGVRTLGIDAFSVDATTAIEDAAAGLRLDAHLAILGVDGVIVENLTRLELAAALRDPVVSVLPLAIAGADGAPVRAVAWERGALSTP